MRLQDKVYLEPGERTDLKSLMKAIQSLSEVIDNVNPYGSKERTGDEPPPALLELWNRTFASASEHVAAAHKDISTLLFVTRHVRKKKATRRK